MKKELEIQGCIEVMAKVLKEEFWNNFIDFIKSNNWRFGGGINKIVKEKRSHSPFF